jgi:hypothetical protein
MYIIKADKYQKLPNPNFSPASGGRVNPNININEISTHGNMRLKMK